MEKSNKVTKRPIFLIILLFNFTIFLASFWETDTDFDFNKSCIFNVKIKFNTMKEIKRMYLFKTSFYYLLTYKIFTVLYVIKEPYLCFFIHFL